MNKEIDTNAPLSALKVNRNVWALLTMKDDGLAT